ncbi:MAG: DNA-binding protein [Aliiglaciecola sp.]
MDNKMCISFSAKEISAQIGITVRVIQKRAAKDGWSFIEKKVRGGKTRCYPISTLPKDIVERLKAGLNLNVSEEKAIQSISETSNLRKEISSTRKLGKIKEFEKLPESTKARANACLSILHSAVLFHNKMQTTKKVAWNRFCEDYNSRSLQFSEDIYQQRPSISYKTLERWNKAFSKDGIIGLVDKYGKNKGKGIIDSNQALKDFCIALIHKYPHIKGEHLHQLLETQFESVYSIPSPTTCRAWLSRWKEENASLYMSLYNPSGWQNKFMSGFGNMSDNIERINQLWEFDSTPADVMLKEGRYSIVGVIDVFTRRVKLILKPTSNAEAIALLVRKAILDWGIPEIAKTDNGADYLANRIVTSWNALEVENRITNPYSGWEKPFIERFFRTFSHGIAELLEGYIGHDVAEREKISGRLTFAKRLMERKEKGAERVGINVELSAVEFQKMMDQWVEFHYHHKKHSKLKCTPFEKFNQHRQSIKRIQDERALDILLAPVPGKGIRTVGKEGISIDNRKFIHAELGPYVGDKVFCRTNNENVGKVFVFHQVEGHFICEAFDPELVDSGIAEHHAIEARKAQKRHLAAQRKAVRESVKNADLSNMAQKFLDHQETKNGSMASFPKKSEFASTPSINSAQEALSSRTKLETYSEEQKTIFERRRQELEEQKRIDEEFSKPTFTNEFQRAKYLTEADANASIPPLDKAWLHDYRRRNKRSALVLDTLKAQTLRNKK